MRPGLVVEVPAEQIAEASVSELEDDGVAVDGVRGGESREVTVLEIERLVADPRPLRRIPQELQALNSPFLRQDRAEHRKSRGRPG